MTTTNETLERAIKYLEAVEVAPGRYAFHVKGAPCWYVVTSKSLAAYGKKQTPIVENPVAMPYWWSPENRTCVTCSKCDGRNVAKSHFNGARLCSGTTQRITANLETGEEMPA